MIKISHKALRFAEAALEFEGRREPDQRPNFGYSEYAQKRFELALEKQPDALESGFIGITDDLARIYLGAIKTTHEFFDDEDNLPSDESDEYNELLNDLGFLEVVEEDLKNELALYNRPSAAEEKPSLEEQLSMRMHR